MVNSIRCGKDCTVYGIDLGNSSGQDSVEGHLKVTGQSLKESILDRLGKHKILRHLELRPTKPRFLNAIYTCQHDPEVPHVKNMLEDVFFSFKSSWNISTLFPHSFFWRCFPLIQEDSSILRPFKMKRRYYWQWPRSSSRDSCMISSTLILTHHCFFLRSI